MSSWRGGIVALVVVALGLPSSNLLWLDGLPMSEAGPFLLLISLLPLLASPLLRCAAFATLGRRTIRALSIAALLGLATKALFLALGPVWGFQACYSSPGRTPEGQCEFSYSGVRIFSGITRIDETVDFGPLATTSGAMTPNPYLTGALIGGVAATNWNLSYLNGLRFNVYDVPGDGKSENLPLRVSWRGTVDNIEPRQLEIQLSGSVSLAIGDAVYTAQSAGTDPRRLVVPVSPGRQPVRIDYAYAPEAVPLSEGGAPFGLIRLHYLSAPTGTRLGGPFVAEHPALGWRLFALTTDVLVGGAALVLAASMLSALHRSSAAAPVLGLLVIAVYCAMRTMPELGLWPFGLACVAAPLIYLERCRYPASAAWIALTVIGFAATVAEAPSLDAVVYRRPGSDWQTYESFARDILERGSLRAGEDVFHYQPGFRYLLFGLRMFAGDNDVFLVTMARLAVTWPFVLLHVAGSGASRAWDRRTILSYLLAAAAILFVTSRWLQSALVVGVSEWPTWSLLPLSAALLFFFPRPGAWAAGAAMLACSALVRVNQLPGIGMSVLAAVVKHKSSARVALPVILLPFVVAAASIPAHNIRYGQRFEVLPTERGDPDVFMINPAELTNFVGDPTVAERLLRQVGLMLFLEDFPPAPEVISRLSWGIYLAWLSSLVALARAPHGDRLWRLLLALSPAAYLAPFLLIKHYNFYPRHLVVGILAACVASMVAVLARTSGTDAAAATNDATTSQ